MSDDELGGSWLAEPSRGGESTPRAASNPPGGRKEDWKSTRFVALRPIGQGGGGRVTLAADQRLVRDVALKEVSADDPAAVARLHREARILSMLEHPNIVPLYDVLETPDGGLGLVLRVLRGRNLRNAIASAPELRARLALLPHLQRTAEAIAWAHHRGIVHRDLKPENVMVGSFGETQVIDWGLALMVDDPADSQSVVPAGVAGVSDVAASFQVQSHPVSQPDDDYLTRAGAIVGTPRYMSPEQARGERATRASDVYGLGAMLFELLAGVAPWSGLDAHQVIARHQKGQRPALPARVSAVVPPELIAITERAMAPNPADRYPDANSFAADLAAWTIGARVLAHRYSAFQLARRVVRQFRWPLLLVLAVLVSGVVAFAISFRRVDAERDRAVIAEQEARAALAERDTSLADALLASARQAAAAGERYEAERAATEVLAIREDPDARGLLATLAHGPGLVRETLVDLPECIENDLIDTGGEVLVLCSDRQHVAISRQVGSDQSLELITTIALPHRDAVFLDGGEHVLIQRLDDHLEYRSVADGRPLTPVIEAGQGRLRHATDGTSAWVVSRRTLTVVSAGRSRMAMPCDGIPLQAATESDGRWHALCDDGRLVSETGETALVDLPLPRVGWPVMRVAGGSLFAGSTDGRVRRLERAEGGWVTRAEAKLPSPGMVHELAVGPGGRWLIASPERGAPVVMDVETFEKRTRFPREDARVFRFTSNDRVITRGVVLSRWHIVDRGVDVLGGLGQINSVLPMPDGALLVGHDGWVTRLMPNHGVVARVHGRGAVKSLATDGARVLVARAPEDVPSEWRTSDLEPLEPFHLPAGRRTVATAGGSFVLGAYEDALRVVWPRPVSLPLLTYPIQDLAVWQDAIAVVEGRPRQVSVFDTPAATRRIIAEPAATAVALGPLSVYVARTGGVAIHDRDSGEPVGELSAPNAVLLEVAAFFHANTLWVVAGARDGMMWLWREDGALAARFDHHTERVFALTGADEGRTLVSGSWDGRVVRADLEVVTMPRAAASARFTARWGTGSVFDSMSGN